MEVIHVLPDSPSSILQLLNADKQALISFAARVINDVEDGKENPLEIQLLTKKYEFVLDKIKEGIKSHVATEAAKYGEKPFAYGNAEIHYTATATSYDYSNCNDPQLNDLLIEQAKVNELVKSRQERLKAQMEAETLVTQSGEIVTVYPPVKKQSMGVKVSIK